MIFYSSLVYRMVYLLTYLLAERFFPTPPADLSDITDTTFADATSKQRFEVNQSVDLAEITQIISSTGAWKAPGRDNLPTGFLKMCGQPLAKAIAKSQTQASHASISQSASAALTWSYSENLASQPKPSERQGHIVLLHS